MFCGCQDISISGSGLFQSEAVGFCNGGSEHRIFTSDTGFVKSSKPSEFMDAFGHIWGKVFGPDTIVHKIAGRSIHQCLQEVGWDWSLMPHHNLAMVQYIIAALTTVAFGLDGIPNLCLDASCSDEPLPSDINVGLTTLLDKTGEAPVRAQAPGMIFRHPLETRPLTLKRADNKLVAGTLDFRLSLAIANGAIDAQTRRIHGRMLMPNAVELDSHSRDQEFNFFWQRTFQNARYFFHWNAEFSPILDILGSCICIFLRCPCLAFLGFGCCQIPEFLITVIKKFYLGRRHMGKLVVPFCFYATFFLECRRGAR